MRAFTDEISYADDSPATPAMPRTSASMRVLGMCRESDVGTTIAHPDSAARVFLPMMLRDRETLCVMLLDADRRVITAFVGAVGTATQVDCDTTVVFRPAVALGASYILIAHNHPSGDPTPSAPDIATTRVLEAAASILGIGFVDHLVLTHTGRYRSIAEFMEKGF